MKRKVNLVGNSTLTVSLPAKWAKKYNIRKGEELELEIKDNSILMSIGKVVSLNSKSIDFTGLQTLIHRGFPAMYKAGYDEIEIFYSEPKELEMIQNEINKNLLGLEIIEQTKKRLKVKEVSTTSFENFDIVLKRVLMALLSIAEDSFIAMKKNDFVELRSITFRDENINRYTDYCRRILNKGGTSHKLVGPLYFLIEQMEKIGDAYRDTCKYIAENEIKCNPVFLKIYEKINELLKKFYYLFYNFNFNKMNDFFELSKEINKNINGSGILKYEMNLAIYLSLLSTNIFDMNGALMAYNI